MRGLLAVVAAWAMLAGSAAAATTVTFDGRPYYVKHASWGGFVSEDMWFHSKGHATLLTRDYDAAMIGSFQVHPAIGGSFHPLSVDVRIVSLGALPQPLSFSGSYWGVDTLEQGFSFDLPAEAFSDFVTVDLSSLPTTLHMLLGVGAPRLGLHGSPCKIETCVSGPGYYTLIDNFTFEDLVLKPGQSVPEPSTWAMMIAGFGLLGAALRRQRQAAPAL